MGFTIRFADTIRKILLSAGTLGVRGRDIQQRVKSKDYKAKDINMLLEAWRRRGWVDKYTMPTGLTNQPTVMWRATDRLQNEWHIVSSVVHEVLTADLPPSVLGAPPSETAGDRKSVV